jgi:deoxyguanosine kinase
LKAKLRNSSIDRASVAKHAYLAFEGPIAAGKTTLTRLLGEYIGATVILEDLDGNEFLADFYGDKKRWALGMQLSFLTSRHAQLRGIARPLSRAVVADYTYEKDAIFAKNLLHDRERRLYEVISARLVTSIEPPDVIVYLDARNDVLLERIRRRNRTYEVSIDSEYLESVRASYDRYLSENPSLKVFRYDTSALDLDSQPQMEGLFRAILAGGWPTQL